MNNIKMLYFDTILMFLKELMLIEQVNQECNICWFWYFFR